MGSCSFCKVASDQLKSCVCKKVAYCSKECQAKDWKNHKTSCPPFIVRESPGKGRGIFASRKIKEGHVILEEYPLLTLRVGTSFQEFKTCYYPIIDEDTKAKILNLYDPAENLKSLDSETMSKLVIKNPALFEKEATSDEASKIYRIVFGNTIQICEEPDLYDTKTSGLFNNRTLFNHSCVPNAVSSWVMGDFTKHKARALRTIEKGEEIVINYQDNDQFVYGSRAFRRNQLLEIVGFLCSCSECSLEGEALEENERMRAEIREKKAGVGLVLGSAVVSRGSMKTAMKLVQERTRLVEKLGLRCELFLEMINLFNLAVRARKMGISCQDDPDVFKQEALKYAMMFGDRYIYTYNCIF